MGPKCLLLFGLFQRVEESKSKRHKPHTHNRILIKDSNLGLTFIIDYNNILLISHNPGLNNIAIDFNDGQYIKFPTSALAHLYSDKNTSNSYDQGDFKLLSISKPKDFL